MKLLVFLVLSVSLTFADNVSPQEYVTCTSEIYCTGDLLSTVQMARVFPDSKTFVDHKLKQSPEITLDIFRAWQAENPDPSSDDVLQFVEDNFDPEGSEFVPWTPSDHVAVPSFLGQVVDEDYQKFGQALHDFWLQLGRQISPDVKNNPDLYSMLYVENPIIVPGGRFREYYYWDSYWVNLGLLHSEMYTTAEGMLNNFCSIVERFGFVPNGGRMYYLGRSQPPLLIPMVKEYFDATNDVQFLRNAIVALEQEFAYWSQESKTVVVKGHTLSIYSDRSSGPRPESYYEDTNSAQVFPTAAEQTVFFQQLKGGAESGMDYSSRWFINNGTNSGTLANVQISHIVPVDLNAILYWNANLLAEFYTIIGNNKKVVEYQKKANKIYKAVQAVFWHEDVGAWLDWDNLNNVRRDYFVPSNLAPLWTNCFDQTNKAKLSKKVLKYLKKSTVGSFPGGVPNTMELQITGQQWDFPNVWPPMQHVLVSGLRNLGTDDANELAYEFASKLLYSQFYGWNTTSYMMEKYSATVIGLPGAGGEYDVQIGFGWSNGVAMDFLKMFGDRLRS